MVYNPKEITVYDSGVTMIGKINAGLDLALYSINPFINLSDLANSPNLYVGYIYGVAEGRLGGPEQYKIVPAASYASASGNLVFATLTPDPLGGFYWAVTQSTEYASYAEAKADPRTFSAGTLLTGPSWGFIGQAVASGGNWGETNAGGQQILVLPWPLGAVALSVTAFGVLADGVTDNIAAINRANAASAYLSWPKGSVGVSQKIKAGNAFGTVYWTGAGTKIIPLSGFTDFALCFIENSTTDFSPVDKTYNATIFDITFDALGTATRSTFSSILYGLYLNWAHFAIIERVSVIGVSGDSLDRSLGIFIGAYGPAGTEYSQDCAINGCTTTYCSNGIKLGGAGVNGTHATGVANACRIVSCRIGGFTTANSTYGVKLDGGYDNTIDKCDSENNGYGYWNAANVNNITNSLAEQNGTDFYVSGGFVNGCGNNFPISNDAEYTASLQVQQNGYLTFINSIGQAENILIDPTFETQLYTSAFIGGSVVSGASYGAYSRNVLLCTGGASATTAAAILVDPQQTILHGWYTLVIRAKATSAILSSLFVPLTPVSSYGFADNHELLEIGRSVFVSGTGRSGQLDQNWRIYSCNLYFNGATVSQITPQVQYANCVIDYIGLFKGLVGCIPKSKTEFEIQVDIGGIAAGSTAQIYQFSSFPTSVEIELDSVSLAASRRIAGMRMNLQNGTSGAVSYQTDPNLFGYSTASTSTNDFLYTDTQSRLNWFQRTASFAAGTKLNTRIKLTRT